MGNGSKTLSPSGKAFAVTERLLALLHIMKHAKFLKNVAVISLSGLIAKGIGAVYRIPLTGMLGGYGTGLYQMAYPLFCVLLTFSSAGIPSALSRMIAGGSGESVMKSALRLFATLGAAGTVLMFLLAPLMSGLQGETALVSCYFALAPSVFFVALIAVFRGYFQGKNDMKPTALSEILEQLVKVFAGLLLARSASDPSRGAAYALFAVSLSELFALFYLARKYKKTKRVLLVREKSGFSVLRASLPVMAAAALLPLSRMADSVIVVRLLSRYAENAVTLYGLFAGAAVSLCSLPATFCYGLVAATVPAVSKSIARGDEGEGRDRAMYALLLTLALSLPFAAALLLFARPIVDFLYPSLSLADRQTIIGLVRLSSLSSVFLAGVDTLSASLTGMGRAKCAAFSMGAAVLCKLALQFVFINAKLLVGGAALAANVSYPIAFFLDLVYTVRKKKVKSYDNGDRLGNGAGRLDFKRVAGAEGSGRSDSPHGKNPRRADLDRPKYSL